MTQEEFVGEFPFTGLLADGTQSIHIELCGDECEGDHVGVVYRRDGVMTASNAMPLRYALVVLVRVAAGLLDEDPDDLMAWALPGAVRDYRQLALEAGVVGGAPPGATLN